MRRFFLLASVTLMVLALSALTLAAPARASHVEPVRVDGNPTCQSLGLGEFEFKPQPEPPSSGTYTFPDGIHTLTLDSDGTYFDWTSTLAIDAVIVKGSSAANVYQYDPEATSDTGLHAPTNSSGGIAEISHISFCYDYEVTVSKDAATTFTRTYDWAIDKRVTPATWDLFTGDEGTSAYTVAVERTGHTDSDWAANGTITVTNDTPFTATLTALSDTIAPDIAAEVSCEVAFPYQLAPGETLTCTYASALPDGSDRLNTATATTEGIVGGNSGTADVTFGDPTTEVNASVTVEDSNGMSWEFDESGAVSYDRTFACDADAGSHPNTATIVETGQAASADVTVNCYALAVSKDAATRYDRAWQWAIDKQADASELTLSIGQQHTVTYEVTVSAEAADSGFDVTGTITIENPNPTRAATLAEVSDTIAPDIAATVDCPALTIPAGETLSCTYEAALPDSSDRLNTATATLQNHAYDAEGNASASGTTEFTGSAEVLFGDPATVTDHCVLVTDSLAGELGTVCADEAPHTFTYSLLVGPYDAPGTYTVANTATFVAEDSGTSGSDDHDVIITVPNEGVGCSLTQGYWKTHSAYGPAPYDDTWAEVGEDTPFLDSGQSWYEVLWTAPRGGNAFYILAHQAIAAHLNGLNGADTSAIDAELADAFALLDQYDGDPNSMDQIKGATRQQFIQLAGTLDDYNNGLIGPGHCDE